LGDRFLDAATDERIRRLARRGLVWPDLYTASPRLARFLYVFFE